MSSVTRGKGFPFINHNANLSGHERIHLLFCTPQCCSQINTYIDTGSTNFYPSLLLNRLF